MLHETHNLVLFDGFIDAVDELVRQRQFALVSVKRVVTGY